LVVSRSAARDAAGVLEEERSVAESAAGGAVAGLAAIHAGNALSVGIDEATSGAAANSIEEVEVRLATGAGIGSSTSSAVLRTLGAEPDGGGGEVVSGGAVAGSVIVGGGSDNTLAAGSGTGAAGASTGAGCADTIEIEETLLAETFLRRKHKSSVGGCHTTDTDRVRVHGEAVRAVGISTAA
jgi:hypothetical protein